MALSVVVINQSIISGEQLTAIILRVALSKFNY